MGARARACSVRVRVLLRGGRNSWFQKEVSHCQQEHRLACLPVKNKAVCSLLELRSGFGLSEEACAFCTDTTHALRGHLQRHRSQQHFSETYQSFVWLNSWLKRVHCGCRKSCFITPARIFLWVAAKSKVFSVQEDYYLQHFNCCPRDTK